MNCPTCGKKLRALQVETMIGNADYNDWCRNGYCSQDCFDKKDPSHALIELNHRPKIPVSSAHTSLHVSSPPPQEPKAYTYANASLIAVPFAMFIGWVGRRAYESPVASLVFLIMMGAILAGGFIGGIIALSSIRKLGREGLLWRSVLGIALILGFTSLAIHGILQTKAEQAGAGQPATRPVDKPVGGDKPQPEAEARRP